MISLEPSYEVTSNLVHSGQESRSDTGQTDISDQRGHPGCPFIAVSMSFIKYLVVSSTSAILACHGSVFKESLNQKLCCLLFIKACPEHAQNLHSVSNIHARSMHGVARNVQGESTKHLPSVHRTCTESAPNLHQACTERALILQWYCTKCALSVHWACTEHAPSVPKANNWFPVWYNCVLVWWTPNHGDLPFKKDSPWVQELFHVWLNWAIKVLYIVFSGFPTFPINDWMITMC